MQRKIGKDLIIVIILILLLNLSVGYAKSSDNLSVSGTSNAKETFSLEFNNAKVEKVVGANVAETMATISNDKKTLNINVSNLSYPGSGVEFSVDIVNVGSVPAKVKQIFSIGMEKSVIEINGLENIDRRILEVGEKTTIHFSVEWPIEETISLDEEISFELQIEYEQSI